MEEEFKEDGYGRGNDDTNELIRVLSSGKKGEGIRAEKRVREGGMEGGNVKNEEITILSNVKVANTYEIPLTSPSKPPLLNKSDSHPMLMLFEPLNADDSPSQMASPTHLICAHTLTSTYP